MKYYANPLNLNYRYQFFRLFAKSAAFREMADPSIVRFKGKYYLFASMTCGFFVSDDLYLWQFHKFQADIEVNDYAPDVCVVGEYLYFSASKDPGIMTPIYRTKDPVRMPFEKVSESISAWDPHMYRDDDGKVWYYWGCSNSVPMNGVQMDPQDMTALSEPKELFLNQKERCGFERVGEDHAEKPKGFVERLVGTAPAIEGPWMTKHNGKYYLQYATPGAQYNVYADAVYECDTPLGDFRMARNNPYSYKPGGFIPGAGHGSTFEDKYGNLWHTATQRISVNQMFERRIGMWPAGFDADGELFCNQRFGDWVMPLPEHKEDPWKEPEWMLLSAGKKATASSYRKGNEPDKATEENIRTWWRAKTDRPGQWLEVDLGKVMQVNAVQINFADDKLKVTAFERKQMRGSNPFMRRYIDQREYRTCWLLEISTDGKKYSVLQDKRNAVTDLSHDLVVTEQGVSARYVRLTVTELPFDQKAAVSGLRVFGIGDVPAPSKPENVTAVRIGNREMQVRFESKNALGHNILWGHAPDKLYHCYTVYGKTEQQIRALIKGQDYYVRVDSFNESGIVHGDTLCAQPQKEMYICR